MCLGARTSCICGAWSSVSTAGSPWEAMLAMPAPIHIEEMWFTRCSITSGGMSKIAKAMRRGFAHDGLKVFRPVDCRISEDCFVEMVRALPPSLEGFCVSGAECGDVGLAALAAALPRTRIKDLSCNHGGSLTVTPVGIAALAASLPRLASLEDLHITEICTDAGMAALAPALPSASALRHVSFELCGLTDTGLQALAAAVARMPELSMLTLYQNSFTDLGVAALRAANDSVLLVHEGMSDGSSDDE